MNRLMTTAAVSAFALIAGALIGYSLRRPASSGAPASAAQSTARAALYWYDPMHPDQHFDKPGKSPFMDMQLVPKYADSADAGGAGITIDPRVRQNLAIRTAVAERGSLNPEVVVVGSVAYDEEALAVVEARARGYLERVYVRKPLAHVRAGEPLADLVAPEWAAAEAEYLALRSMSGATIPALRAAARQRLAVVGVPDDAIRRLDRTGKASSRVTLTAPRDGVVASLDAREGQAVEPGMPLFRINGLDRVWVHAEVPEQQARGIEIGVPAKIEVAAFSGRTFSGTVDAVLPDVDAATRTERVRIELANPDRGLAPGMYATVRLAAGQSREAVLVPSEAVIRTGTRTVVIVADAGGAFRPVEVRTGAESGDRIAILDGLDAGARVVVSGQFLIDSEANLRGTLTRMNAPEETRP